MPFFSNLPGTRDIGAWALALLEFVWRHLGLGWGFVQSLPQPIPLLPYLAIVTACAGVVLSHVLAILKFKQHWVQRENCNLMYGYFMGSGVHQAKLVYGHALWQIRQGKWAYGISGAAYYLGDINYGSRIVNFLLSIVYIPLMVLGLFELFVRTVVGIVYLLIMMLLHRLLLLVFKLLSYGFILLAGYAAWVLCSEVHIRAVVPPAFMFMYVISPANAKPGDWGGPMRLCVRNCE